MTDEDWMRQALELAERGRGLVEPNPLAGALVVRDDTIVGQGWHQRFGEAHAEVNALNQAGEAARGATLYVTLEPCCHTGKTPPCTDAIIRARIRRVVAAMNDPFPKVAGKGIAILGHNGITVDVGVCEGQAIEQNRPYLTLLRLGRPYVHAKWAMTLDGKIADKNRKSRYLSCEKSLAKVHQLRARMDAIVVGAGTVRADDPQLTARPPGPRVVARIVLSSSGTLPENCQLLRTILQAPVIIATFAGRGDSMRQLGCEVIELPADESGRPSVTALLNELGRRRMTNILVEGGSAIFGSFYDAQLIDELHVYTALTVLGGKRAVSPIGGEGFGLIDNRRPLSRYVVQMCGTDVYVIGQFQPEYSH